MTAQKLERQITDLQRRREALAADVQSATAALERARQRLVSGAADVAEVTSCQSTTSALTEAVASIDAQLTALSREEAVANAEELRQRNETRAVELSVEKRRLQAEYEQVRIEADEALSLAAARMIELGGAYSAAKREHDSIVPGVGGLLASRDGLRDTPLRFGVLLAQAVGTLANEADRARRKADTRRSAA
jgi:chromosome segregation ATPase